MNTKYKECKGCTMVNICTMKPKDICEGDIIECPCATCIVKTMCNNPCNLYGKYLYTNLINSTKDKETNLKLTDTKYTSIEAEIENWRKYERT